MSTCKATVKSTGVPCKNSAKENGYCGVHKNVAAQREQTPPTSPPRSRPLNDAFTPPPATDALPRTCKAIVKSTGVPCTLNAKENGYCGVHKNEAAKQARVALAPSTPSPAVRIDTSTRGKGFGIFGLSGEGKKTEKKAAIGRRGAMAEVHKICRTEDTEKSDR